MTAGVQGNKSKHTRGEQERYLIKTIDKTRCTYSANVAFNTATYERTNRCETTEERITGTLAHVADCIDHMTVITTLITLGHDIDHIGHMTLVALITWAQDADYIDLLNLITLIS